MKLVTTAALAATLAVSIRPAVADDALLTKTRGSAINFLRTTQADDGSWTTADSPGIPGLVAFALLENGVGVDDPTVSRALTYLEGFVQKDGGIYNPKGHHRNYETCITVLVFSRANADGRYTKRIAAAKDFLKNLQWDKGEGLEDSDVAFGGAGYGSKSRPDLSNTTFLVEALRAAGVPQDDPAMQAALVFVSRTQNLESEHNQTKFAAKINDGGFYYTPAAGGTSQAGTNDDGGLRSYGSMTYAGLKSMIYAGVEKDDPRVKAARGWIAKNYTLDRNPGLGMQGLFYYYHTFAKTLNTLEVDEFVDSDGDEHDWRADLVTKLAALQKSNGSWVNEASRWYEGDPNLATAYGLMALAYCGEK